MCPCKIALVIYVLGYFITLFCMVTYTKLVKGQPNPVFLIASLMWPIGVAFGLIYIVATSLYLGTCFLADKAIETLQSIAQKIKKD